MIRKLILLFSVCTLFQATLFAQTSNSLPQQYIEKYKELAINEMIRTGVPAAITLAQGILESGSGQSDLALRSNNHFGIKCKLEWTGDKVYQDDDEANECFRSYPTVEDSYRDHSDFLKNRSNYAFLFNIPPTDFESWCKGLKKAGYATSPAYPKMLMDVINKYNLQDYTLLALERMNGKNQTAGVQNQSNNTPVVSINTIDEVAETPVKNIQNDTSKKDVVAKADMTVVEKNTDTQYPSGVFTINQCKVIYVNSGSSLFAVSAQQNIDFAKLLAYNELNSGDILENGKLIFLQKKAKKSNKKFHIISGTESLTDVSQSEGVQLQSILAYNNLTSNQQVQAGTKILLQPPPNSKDKGK
ncbi:MAG: glucosaminidase domain-containing protein [Chitinophagaceae bacterium]